MSTSDVIMGEEEVAQQALFNISLNIEGRTFLTTESTTKSLPLSVLGTLNEDSKYFDHVTNSYSFDRNSNLFPHILAAHRDGEVHVPQGVCAIRFRKELEFWRIPKSLIAPCCWNYFYSTDEDLETLNTIVKTLPNGKALIPEKCLSILDFSKTGADDTESHVITDDGSCLHTIWTFLDEPRSSVAAKVWCIFYLIAVMISVILNLIWLEEWARVEPYLMVYKQQQNDTANEKITRLLLTDPHKVMLALDSFCTMFFVLENLVHFATCPNKSRYMFNYLYATKTMLSFCMLYSAVFEVRKDWLTSDTVIFIWCVVRSMNAMRSLLFLRIIKFSNTLNVLYLASFDAWRELVLLLFMLLLMMFVYGGMIFAIEMDSDMFPDTLSSMWWALITMTTIGYGDFHPTRPLGYAVGTLCAVQGIMMIALPIAVMASVFSKYKDRNEDLQKHLEAIQQEEKVLSQMRTDTAAVEDSVQKHSKPIHNGKDVKYETHKSVTENGANATNHKQSIQL